MHETLTQSPVVWETPDGIRAAALRAEAWAGEPFLEADDDRSKRLRPGSALRRALEDALAEMDAGLPRAVARMEGALRAHARARARALGEAAPPRLRHRAAPPPGRRARRDAHRADRRGREGRRRPERQRQRERRRRRGARRGGRRGGRRTHGRASTRTRARPRSCRRSPAHDPGAERRYRFRHPTASGKTIAAAGFVEAARTEGVLILTHRRLLVSQFRRELTEHGYGERLTDVILEGSRRQPLEPDHDPDLRLVRAARRRGLAHAPTSSSSATRRTRRSARRPPPRSAA